MTADPKPTPDPTTDPGELAAREGSRRAAPSRPLARGRRPSLVAGVYLIIAAGVVLILSGILGDAGRGETVTAIAVGVLFSVLGTAVTFELLPLRALGWLGLLGGVALGVSGLAVRPVELDGAARLLAGAILLLAAAGILASRDGPPGGEPAETPHAH